MNTLPPIKIAVPANLQLSEGLREFVSNILRVVGFDQTWTNRLVLVVDEVFMNAVKYGSVENKSEVQLSFYPKQDHLFICIEDEGNGGKKVEVEELKGIISANEENNDLTKSSGRGLSLIVTNWTDNYEIEKSDQGGTRVNITKYYNTTDKTPVPTTDKNKKIITPRAVPHQPEDIFIYEFKAKYDIHSEEDKSHLLSTVENCGKKLVILDMKNVTYINSVFIGLITKVYNKLNLAEGMLALCNLSSQIEDTLNLVGLSNILILADNLEEAKSLILSR